MKASLRRIKAIEAAAYPPSMRQLQNVATWKEVADYCECRAEELLVLSGESWYLLAAEHEDYVEIADLAATGGLGSAIWRIIAAAKGRWAGKTVVCDARQGTSYCLLKALERRGIVRVISETPWEWEDEKMFEVKLKVK